MTYYPDNTVSNYTTHLPTTVRLSNGEWEVAIVEAHYPWSFLTVGEDASITVDFSLPELKVVEDEEGDTVMVAESGPLRTDDIKVEPGYYKDVEELVEGINATRKVSSHATFLYDKTTGTVSVDILDHVTRLVLSSALALQLGFDPHNENLVGRKKGRRPADVHASLPTHMYVYCDLVEPQLVGDTVAPLLKIVNIDTRNYMYGGRKIEHFNDPHYVPVIKSTFESVEIDLRDNAGRHLPFRFGTSCMKLHLRRAASE